MRLPRFLWLAAAALCVGLPLVTSSAYAQSATDFAHSRPDVSWKPPTAGAISAGVDLTTAIGLPECSSGSVLSYAPNRFGGRGWGCVNSVTNATTATNASQLEGRDLAWVRGHATGGNVDHAATASDANTLGGQTQTWIRNNGIYASNAGDAATLGGHSQSWIRANATGGTVDYAVTAERTLTSSGGGGLEVPNCQLWQYPWFNPRTGRIECEANGP